MSLGEGKKQYKKAPAVQEKETQTEILYVKSESQIDTDKRLDAIITSTDKYIVSNSMEMSDSSVTDYDDST